ncbi:MAG: hypothetical protein RLZZ94_714 [Bacteroidota bacterium]
MKKIFLISLLILCSTYLSWAQDISTSKEIKIGLLMSFQLKEQLIDDTNKVAEPAIVNTVLPSLQFYEGALMATNHLKEGKVKFVITDLGKDSTSTVTALQKAIKDTCDFYFAMVPSNCNLMLMKFIKRCKRPVVSLNSIPQALMKVNSGLWLATPSNLTQLKQFSNYLFTTDSNANYLVIHRNDKKEEQLVNFIYSELDSLTGKSARIAKFNFKGATWDLLKPKLSSKKENYIIVPTNDESFLTTVVEMLATNKGNYKITLCGLPSWEGFESISPLELTGLKTTIFNGYFIDYNLASVKEFRQDYIDEYHADPIANSFIGYDMVNYILQNIYSMKVDVELFENNYQCVSGQSFLFERSISGGCVENKFFNVLRYDTDRLVKQNK